MFPVKTGAPVGSVDLCRDVRVLLPYLGQRPISHVQCASCVASGNRTRCSVNFGELR